MSATIRSRFLLSALSTATLLSVVAPVASALPPPLPPINRQPAPQQRQQQRPQTPRSNASLVFDKNSHDFGRIFDHEKQDLEFKFTNEGTEDLVINLVKPTCGCTLANIYKVDTEGERHVLDSADPKSMTFAPGENGLIDITFNPKGKKGQQDRKVNVFSNDKTSPQRSVSIKGFVRPVVQIDPPLASLGSINIGESKTFTVRVMGISEGFEASRPTFSQLGIFTAKVIGTEEIEYQGDIVQATTIEITVSDKLKSGTYNIKMHVRTNDERQRIVDIPVFVAVKGPIEVVPPRLAIGNIRAGNPINRSFLVRSRNGENFEITQMKLDREDLAGLVFTSKVRKEGDLTQHVITVSGVLDQPMARTNASLTIVTTLKEHNTIEMPLVLGVIK